MKRIVVPILMMTLALAGSASAQYSSYNQSFFVSGAGYISVPNNNAFNGALTSTGIVAIDAWVYPTSFPGFMTIVGNDYTAGYWFGVAPNGRLRFYPNPASVYDCPIAIPANQWSHVAVVYNGRKQSLIMYINGAVAGSFTTPSGTVGYQGGDLRIGADRQGNTASYYWVGRLDEVRIWKDELNFTTALGALWRVPHAVVNGRYGRALIGCWRMNGSASDETGTGNGSVVGTGSFSMASPQPGHEARICAVFSNTQSPTGGSTIDYFSVSGLGGVSLTRNFTLECWVKPAATGGAATTQTLLYKGSDYAQQRSYGLMINKSNGRLRFMPNGSLTEVLESNAALPVGQWSHVAARYTVVGTTRTSTVFINGVPSGSRSHTVDAIANQFDLLIGRADPAGFPGSGNGFAGSLDEIRIWNVARTDQEILDSWRLEYHGPQSGLAAMYYLNGDMYDAAGSNHGSRTLPQASDLYYLSASDLPAEPQITVVNPNGGNTWHIGGPVTISWTSTGLQHVRIQLSRDGGQTWGETLTASTAAPPGSFGWVVTGPPTQSARIRILTVTSTGVEDISDADFTIADPQPALSVTPKSLIFGASENGPLPPPQTLYLANTGGGTLSYTASASPAAWLSVVPVGGSGNSDSVVVSIISTALAQGSYSGSITFGGNASNVPVTIPVTYRVTTRPLYSIAGRVLKGNQPLPDIELTLIGDINASTSTAGDGRYLFTSVPQGDYQLFPSSPFYEFAPATRSYAPLSANQTTADFQASDKRGTVRIHVKEGWNLLSLPLTPDVSTLASLFPMAIPPAYAYVGDSGYVAQTSLVPGRGYWVKFAMADSIDVTGVLLPSLGISVTSSFGGWNLIGMTAGSVSIPSIIQIPSGLLVVVYGYDPDFGYAVPPDHLLRAGNAYFVKAATSGSLLLNASAALPPPPPDAVRTPTVGYPGLVVPGHLPLPPPPPGGERVGMR